MDKDKGALYKNFYWQDGYAIFSVNPQQESAVANYIANQKAHHVTMSFQDECRMFYRAHRHVDGRCPSLPSYAPLGLTGH
jgi:putative transposase